jgi:hypothetical protein
MEDANVVLFDNIVDDGAVVLAMAVAPFGNKGGGRGKFQGNEVPPSQDRRRFENIRLI